jgi:hypothetical protein
VGEKDNNCFWFFFNVKKVKEERKKKRRRKRKKGSMLEGKMEFEKLHYLIKLLFVTVNSGCMGNLEVGLGWREGQAQLFWFF